MHTRTRDYLLFMPLQCRWRFCVAAKQQQCCTSFAGVSFALLSRQASPRCSFRHCSWNMRHFTPGWPTSMRYTSRFRSRIFGPRVRARNTVFRQHTLDLEVDRQALVDARLTAL